MPRCCCDKRFIDRPKISAGDRDFGNKDIFGILSGGIVNWDETDSGTRSTCPKFTPWVSGILYVNTFGGKTVALNSHNGQRIWQVQGGRKPSTPAIAGPRLIVSSHDGYVTAYNRFNGF